MEEKVSKSQNSNLFLFVSVLFCTCLLIANVCAFKLINIGPIVITSGVLLFPITYIVNDLMAEVYGYKKAKKVILFGFAMNVLMVLYFQLAIALPYPEFFTGQEMFSTVLGSTWRVFLGSLTAYLVGSLSNAVVMSKMKIATNGSHLAVRAVVSTLVGEMLDSIIFVCIVFAFVYDWKTIITMIVTQTVVKTLYEIIIFPVTARVIRKVKAVEGIDVFDTDIFKKRSK